MANKSATSSQPQARGVLAKPLDSLFFLLPLILFYELATLFLQTSAMEPTGERVVVLQFIQTVFEMLGTSGASWAGLVVVAVLLATHVVSGQPWRFRAGAVTFMYAESAAWALPLIAVSYATQMAATRFPDQTILANMALCVGAGIYEELIFRLILISALVIIGADILRFPHASTLTAAVLAAAVAFAIHHHPPFGSDPFDAFRFTFRLGAGVYLGVIFIFRGYGPAAGAHIAYNVLVVSLFT